MGSCGSMHQKPFRRTNVSIKQNSVSLNGQKVQDENADVREHRTGAGAVVMSVGKTKRFLIRFNG